MPVKLFLFAFATINYYLQKELTYVYVICTLINKLLIYLNGNNTRNTDSVFFLKAFINPLVQYNCKFVTKE